MASGLGGWYGQPGARNTGSGVPLNLGYGNTAPPVATPAAPPPVAAPPPAQPPPPPPQVSSQRSSSTSSSGGATPYGAAGETADTLQNYGTGLLDPNSPESQRWMEKLREEIGRSTEASQRAAGYMAAQGGVGAGASPEMLEMETLLGVAGREAEGEAASDFMLKAPTLGVDALGTALGPQTQMRGQDLNAQLAEMGFAQSGEQSNAQLEMQQRNLDLERDRMEQDRYLRELMLEYGGY